jgi:hypothetical protein
MTAQLLPDRVKYSLATTGTALTLTLGSVVASFLALPTTYNGKSMPYVIEDGNNSELQYGTFTYSAGTWTVTRMSTPRNSTNSGALLNLTTSAIMYIEVQGPDVRAFGTPPFDNVTSSPYTPSPGYVAKLNATAIVVNLPASPGEGGLPIILKGINGDEPTSPHQVYPNGTDQIFSNNVGDTELLIDVTNRGVVLTPRGTAGSAGAGWDL